MSLEIKAEIVGFSALYWKPETQPFLATDM